MRQPRILLRPCPFCGTAGTIIKNAGRLKNEQPKYHAACNNQNCIAFTGMAWHDTEQKAADQWNTRV